MLFKSKQRWWGTAGERLQPHEGIDICFYRDLTGTLQQLTTSARIPVMYAGEVVRISPDYLGNSIFVVHDFDDGKGRLLYSVYGHVDMLPQLGVGSVPEANQIIATLCDASRRNPSLPAHLHLTLAWIPRMFAAAELSWRTLQSSAVILIDPLTLLDCRYELLGER